MSNPVVLEKADIVDPASRVKKLVSKWDKTLGSKFIEMVENIKNAATVKEIADLIEAGKLTEAIKLAENYITRFGTQVNQAFRDAGESAESFLVSKQILVSFDQTNGRAVRLMQENRLRVIREFTEEQRVATRQALTRGIQAGDNPITQARAFRNSIGLTSRQEAAVNNYRSLLQQNSSESLTRQLRDRRFDRTVQRAIGDSQPLTSDQIDVMVSRYRERYLQLRSRTIARTEALAAVHEGNKEMYQQAIDTGHIHYNALVQRWNTSHLANVRDSHEAMDGQERSFGEPFESGDGNLLDFPGDKSAPASDTIKCACAVSTRIRRD